jgi:hypothetical protein
MRREGHGALLDTLDEALPGLAQRTEPLVVDVLVAPDDHGGG